MLIVLASGNGTNFEKIAEQFSVDLLICDKPNAFVMTRAKQLNVEHKLCRKDMFDSREAFDRKLAQIVNDSLPSELSQCLIVLAGFMHILGQYFFKNLKPGCKIINLHPAHREDYKGPRAYEYAIEKKFPRWGLSVHEATLKLDSGPLLASFETHVFPLDTPESLHTRLRPYESKLLIDTISQLLKGFTPHA